MVDFEKLLGKKTLSPIIDPIEIFSNLDKKTGKEFRRPPQTSVLTDWFSELRDKRDIIVKLHTGQGKTLIGLLMLQSSINEGKGPALYVCPNSYLVTQTAEQAKQFGIETILFESGSERLPKRFLNSETILVATCSKLFNGKSVFGVKGSGNEPVNLGAVVVDDAHKCLDIIKDAFSIKVDREVVEKRLNPLYGDLLAIFGDTLKRQAPGTYAEIENGDEGSFLAVPFWAWHDRINEVISLLFKRKGDKELFFVWDLLKDRLDCCICIFSGKRIEISPRLLPLEMIPSFTEAKRRILLSATLTEDAFLVRDLGISRESVSSPLMSGDVKYSGERLILMPTLVDANLTRNAVISWLCKLASKHGEFGVVSIVPSFGHAKEWVNSGAKATRVQDLHFSIGELGKNVEQKTAKYALILVNEYDGVDLPDDLCRLLCLDSLPSYSTLIDKYNQYVRPGSRVMNRQLAQRVEQGMGRAIRGSSDWCIVVIAGNNLTGFLSERSKRGFLSSEAQTQIKIAEDLAEEMKAQGKQFSVMDKLIDQCLKREPGWKEYYKEKMSTVGPGMPSVEYLERSVSEREIELLYQQGLWQKAVEAAQNLANGCSETSDKGWYLQLKATYLYPTNPAESMEVQLSAHAKNSCLFRPEKGISYPKLESAGINRVTRIIDWIKTHDSHNTLVMDIVNIEDTLKFGSLSDPFEDGIYRLGVALGFPSQRPEKATGAGPDDLWNISDQSYWIIECHNMTAETKDEISKRELGQLGTSIGWFKEKYEGSTGLPVIIHPANILAKDAYLSESFYTLQPSKLEELKGNVTNFYNSLKGVPLDSIGSDLIKKRLKEHILDSEDLVKHYLQRPEGHKAPR